MTSSPLFCWCMSVARRTYRPRTFAPFPETKGAAARSNSNVTARIICSMVSMRTVVFSPFCFLSKAYRSDRWKVDSNPKCNNSNYSILALEVVFTSSFLKYIFSCFFMWRWWKFDEVDIIVDEKLFCVKNKVSRTCIHCIFGQPGSKLAYRYSSPPLLLLFFTPSINFSYKRNSARPGQAGRPFFCWIYRTPGHDDIQRTRSTS